MTIGRGNNAPTDGRVRLAGQLISFLNNRQTRVLNYYSWIGTITIQVQDKTDPYFHDKSERKGR